MNETDNNIPEWRKAWKVDDLEWVKQRKKAWLAIKRSPAYINASLRSKEKTRLKNFFMTGIGVDPIKLEFDPKDCDLDNMPLEVQDSVLFEVWLSANQTEEHIQTILGRNRHGTRSGRQAFTQIMNSYNDLSTKDELATEGSMFAGSDERLYKTLAPTNLFATDEYEAFSQEVIKLRGKSCLGAYGTMVAHFMTREYYPSNIAPTILDEWLPCLSQAILDSKHWHDERMQPSQRCPLDYFELIKKRYLEQALYLLDNLGGFDDVQVDFAKRIIEGFRTMTVNEEVDSHVKELLSTAVI